MPDPNPNVPNIAGPFDIYLQTFYWDGKPGLCTPSILNNANLLVGWCFQTADFNWTTNTGDLVSPASGTSLTMFSTGQGEPMIGTTGWFNQTEDLTNLPVNQEGSPVCRGNMFFARGMIVESIFPYARVDGTAGSATVEPVWLGKDGSNGPMYGSRVQRATLNRVSISIKHDNPTVQYQVGVARQWPGWPNVVGNSNVGNGQISNVVYVPFNTVIAFGPKDDCRQLSVILKWGQQHVIKNDVTQPIVDTSDHLLYTPVMITLVGSVCTDPQSVVCVAPQPPMMPAQPQAAAPAQRPYF